MKKYIEDRLKKYKSKIEHRLESVNDRVNYYENNKESLSQHGYWSLGYYIGKQGILEDLLDEIDEILE